MREANRAGVEVSKRGQNDWGHSRDLHSNPHSLDILTAKGQKTLEDEQAAVSIWIQHFPFYKYIETAKDSPAVIDAFLVKDGVIRAGVETKCRYDMTLETFKTERQERWLITHEKLETARFLCAQLHIPLIGFLYFVKDRALAYKILADKTGVYTVDIQIAETQTQRTVNGGQIVRANAFVDMTGAKVLK